MSTIKNKYQRIVEAVVKDFEDFSEEFVVEIVMDKIRAEDAISDYELDRGREYISELVYNMRR